MFFSWKCLGFLRWANWLGLSSAFPRTLVVQLSCRSFICYKYFMSSFPILVLFNPPRFLQRIFISDAAALYLTPLSQSFFLLSSCSHPLSTVVILQTLTFICYPSFFWYRQLHPFSHVLFVFCLSFHVAHKSSQL